ncbi:MAG: aldehyde dehydrogenase family protein [Ilumatobacteraceae bacterium]
MSDSIQIVSPVNGEPYSDHDLLGEQQVMDAGRRARRAQPQWADVPLADRQAVCRRFIELFAAQRDEIVTELAWLMGRPISAGSGEVRGVIERCTYLIDVAPEALADQHFDDLDGFDRWASREPLGVVFVIAPWNYPYLTAVNSIVPALLSGNAVLLKHATQTTPCANRLADTFSAAGLPDDLLVPLVMSHRAAADLVGSTMVDQVVLTGSVEAGRTIQQAASGRFIGVATELGGKDPAYVRADADLAHTVASLVDGSFFNSGQSCCAIERIYVHSTLFDDVVESFVEETNRLVLGNPLDASTTLGPMVTARAADDVRLQVADAIQAGARALIDPLAFVADAPGSAYLAPQVLVDVDHGMALMSEETFGPAIGIMSVADDAEAVRLMNDSRYGLSASVWSRDADAVRRIDGGLETGTVFMNRCDYLDPMLPWVGVKDTGRGCSLSTWGFHALTRPKSHHYRLSG